MPLLEDRVSIAVEKILLANGLLSIVKKGCCLCERDGPTLFVYR